MSFMDKVYALPDYYDRTDPTKRYTEHLILAARGIQNADFNELQGRMHEMIKNLGDSIHSDGDVISGCAIDVNPDTGIATMATGHIYIDGEVLNIPAATLTIPPDADVAVGVWVAKQIITEQEDPSLLDPAVGTDNYECPGAYRVRRNVGWGFNTDTVGDGEFYGVYRVSEGTVQVPGDTTTSITGVTTAMARYDRDAHGNYIVNGLSVRSMSSPTPGKQVFTVEEGRAHVDGWPVDVPYALRVVLDEEAELYTVSDEPHVFTAASGAMRINLNHTPVERVTRVEIKSEKTVTLTHGSYSGAMDILPDTSVAAIIEIKQGTTVYASGTDYRLTADKVDWSPSGVEPSPGASYTVKYHFYTTATPTGVDTTGFTVSGAVQGSDIRVTYEYRLPRNDILVIDKDSRVSRIKGIPSRYVPVDPSTPTGTLKLCSIFQTWEGVPVVQNNGILALRKSDLVTMGKNIDDLYDLIAIERLKTDAKTDERVATLGVFVDPLRSDAMRDQGVPQTGAIVDGNLMMPLSVQIQQTEESENYTLPYVLEAIINQDWRTGSKLVNPYMAYAPLPVGFSISPTVDRWNEVTSQFTSSITQRVFGGWTMNTTDVGRVVGSSTSSQLLSQQTLALATIRSRSVAFSGSGFGPSEHVQITFDGINVTTATADNSGVISGEFVIPSGIPMGTKLVRAVGTNSLGAASYTAQGTVTIEQRRLVTTLSELRYDPLAQTFTLSEARQVAGADIFFTHPGTSQVRVQLRTTIAGMPSQSIIAEASKMHHQISANTMNRFEWGPVHLEAGTEYALVVLTDDAEAAVGIAQLGKWDNRPGRGWVTSQPYQTGVLLSSSNASTWTPHQDTDMCFALLAAKFTSDKRLVSLGSVNMDGVTDILPVAEVERTAAATDVVFILKNPSGTEVGRCVSGQLLSMTSPLESGVYSLHAEITGDSKHSAVLFSGTQLIHAVVGSTCDYVSRAFTGGAGKKVAITLEANLPGSSGLLVYIQSGATTWAEASLVRQENTGDGWKLFRYECSNQLSDARIKMVLTGSPAARPRVRNPRAVSLDG